MNSQMNKRYFGLIGFLAVLIVWCLIYLLGLYNPLLIPSPLDVAETFFDSLIDIRFLTNLAATFGRIIIAFLISSIIGISLGLIIGYYQIVDFSTKSLIDFIRSIPGIVLFPLFILFFGVGDVSRLLVAIFIAIPIILINTKYGVLNSNKLRKNMRKLYNLDNFTLFYKVIIPEASPYIFTGLRIAVSLIIIVVIVTEMMLGTTYGLGQVLVNSQFQFETPLMYSIIILLGCIGFILNLCFNKIENKIFHWR
ncbi:ABC transporter permease subunit [Candidatus Woesearchaeota archaeon]|nr:ABC transporter permease subunit [Candidatus Woesearchaeota archaeon]